MINVICPHAIRQSFTNKSIYGQLKYNTYNCKMMVNEVKEWSNCLFGICKCAMIYNNSEFSYLPDGSHDKNLWVRMAPSDYSQTVNVLYHIKNRIYEYVVCASICNAYLNANHLIMYRLVIMCNAFCTPFGDLLNFFLLSFHMWNNKNINIYFVMQYLLNYNTTYFAHYTHSSGSR